MTKLETIKIEIEELDIKVKHLLVQLDNSDESMAPHILRAIAKAYCRLAYLYEEKLKLENF